MTAFAIDTNVAIYAFSKDERRLAAMRMLDAGPRISIQLLNEFAAVSLRKRRLEWAEIEESLDIITTLASSTRSLDFDVHDLARVVAQRHKINFYDALIVAAALLDDCEMFYSEDMQDGLTIEGRLTIRNPFREPV